MKYPRVIYVDKHKQVDEDYTDKVNEIFNKLTLTSIPSGLVNIKKEQLVKHSMCRYIVSCLDNILGLLGQTDDKFHMAEFDYYTDELIYYHCPFYLTMNNHFEERSNESCVNYEYWDLFEVYEKYYELVNSKCWNDYYSIFDGFRVYQVVDMLNDLFMCGVIKGYDGCWLRDFESDWNDVVGDDFMVEVFL